MKSSYIWLCLRFPYLSFESLGLSAIAQQNTIIVSKKLVYSVSRDLIYKGIKAGDDGLKVQLSFGVKSLERDAIKEQALLEDIGHIIYQFSPHYTQHLSDSLLIEVSSCLKLFGGLEELINAIEKALENAYEKDYLSYQIGLAKHSHAAWLSSYSESSRSSKDQLEGFLLDNNVSALRSIPLLIISNIKRFEPAVESTLKMGFNTVSDLLKQEYFSISKRVGNDFCEYVFSLDDSFLPSKRPSAKKVLRHTVLPDEKFNEKIEFEYPAITIDQLKQGFKPLLTLLSEFLTSYQQQATILIWTLHSIKKESHHEVIHIQPLTHDWNFAYELTLLHFESRNLEFEIDCLELNPDGLSPIEKGLDNAGSFSFSFSGGGSDDNNDTNSTASVVHLPSIAKSCECKDKGQMVSTLLRAKLGPKRISQIAHQKTYVPEKSIFVFNVDGTNTLKKSARKTINADFKEKKAVKKKNNRAAQKTSFNKNKSAYPIIFSYENAIKPLNARPLWLFDPPHMLRLSNQRFYYKIHGHSYELKLLSAAERITYHWLGELIWRDYYVGCKVMRFSGLSNTNTIDAISSKKASFKHKSIPEKKSGPLRQSDASVLAQKNKTRQLYTKDTNTHKEKLLNGEKTDKGVDIYAQRYWIYKDLNNGQWYVHGLF